MDEQPVINEKPVVNEKALLSLPKETIEKIIQFLVRQPYNQVFLLIDEIRINAKLIDNK